MFLLNRNWKWELQQLRLGLKLTREFSFSIICTLFFTISLFIVGCKKWCSSQNPKWHLQNRFLFVQPTIQKTLKDSSFAVMTWQRKAAKSSRLRGWKQQMFATLLLEKWLTQWINHQNIWQLIVFQLATWLIKSRFKIFQSAGIASSLWAYQFLWSMTACLLMVVQTLPNSDVSLLCLRCWKPATRKKQRRKILKHLSEQHGFKFPEYHVPDKSHSN